jgi:hypothetical protein
MNRIFTLAFCFLWFVTGCSEVSEDNDHTGFIDYAELNLIEVELDLEIGESEQFIPGELSDLVVFQDGIMLVSDQSRVTIEQFNAEGEYIGNVAGVGRGPGELPSNFYLMGYGPDMLLAIHQRGRKDYFVRGTDGTFTHTRGVLTDPGQNRLTSVVGIKNEAEFFVMITEPAFSVNLSADYTYTEYHNEFLGITNAENHILQDSLHILKTPSPYLHIRRNADLTMRSLDVFEHPPFPYRSQDRFLVMEDGRYMIARVDSSAFFIYNSDDELEHRIDLKIIPRPVEGSDLERFDQNFRRFVPDVKPPFLDVWLSKEKILLHTDSDEDNREFVLLNFEGELLGKFQLPEMDEIRHISNDRIYTIHWDPDVGHSIRIYRLDL